MFRAKDRQKCQQLFDRYYAGYKFFDVLYWELIKKYLRPGCLILDAGCGHYLNLGRRLSGEAQVIGIDLEPNLLTDNRHAPFAIRGDLGRLPFPSESFDLVVSRSVVEHLADPTLVFLEFSRVLRQGGKVITVTPNKYDYVSVLAAITPHWLHRRLVSKIFGVSADDVFPTLYRANTRSSIRKAMTGSGLVERELKIITHYPAYLTFSPVLFRLGVLYERLTLLECFSSLRSSIVCVFEKSQPSAMSSDPRAVPSSDKANQPSVEVS